MTEPPSIEMVRLSADSVGIELDDGRRVAVFHPLLDGNRWNRFSVELLVDQILIHDQYGVNGKLGRGQIVLDVGASVGLFTWMAGSQGARVYSFEPNPKEFPLLQACIAANHIPAEAIQAAVGDSDGTARFSCGFRTTLGDGQVLTDDMELVHVEDDSERERGSVDVRMLTLDRFASDRNLNRVDLIKVDTEGSESAVLRGAERIIREFRPIILLASYHRKDDADVLPQIVSSISPSYSFVVSEGDPPHTDPMIVCVPPECVGW